MNKICYKVALYNANEYESIGCGFLPQQFILRYSIGEKTIPKIGRIFVFNSIQNAKNFMRKNVNLVILKGLAENIGKPKVICDYAYLGLKIEFFWETKRKHKKVNYFIQSVPPGTLTCTAFTPIELLGELSLME